MINIGEKYGMLTVISFAGKSKYMALSWNCICECGAEKVVVSSELKSGHTKSCGCYRAKRIGDFKRTHGMCRAPEYNIWSKIIRRCENVNDADYKDYGGRGIKICTEWRESFEKFFDDMGARPTELHSIDRVRVNGNYEKDNCRWALNEVQCRNKRNNILISFNGSVKILQDWANELNVTRSVFKTILKHDKNYQIIQHESQVNNSMQF